MTETGPSHRGWTARRVVKREVVVDGERLVYWEMGSGRPLLLIHGLGGSGRWWFPLFDSLASAGLRVLAPDLPGFGRSQGRPLPIDAAARRLLTLMDHLGVPRFAVAGHSMGGAIAVAMAAQFGPRVRRLVLIDSAGLPENQVRRAFGQLLRPWRWSSMRFFPTLVGDMARAGPLGMWWAGRYLLSCDVKPWLPHVRVPTLLIWGEKDGLIPPDHAARFAAALPHARLEIIPNARHLPMVSRPERTAQIMLSFLAER